VNIGVKELLAWAQQNGFLVVLDKPEIKTVFPKVGGLSGSKFRTRKTGFTVHTLLSKSGSVVVATADKKGVVVELSGNGSESLDTF
jgi:hypothetical protein